MARHDVGGGVAHQDDVDARSIHEPGQRVVVGSQHGDFLAVGLHLLKSVGRDALGPACDRHALTLRIHPCHPVLNESLGRLDT